MSNPLLTGFVFGELGGRGCTCAFLGLALAIFPSPAVVAQTTEASGEVDFQETPSAPIEGEQTKLGQEGPRPADPRAPNVDWGVGGKVQLDITHDFNALGLQPDSGFYREFVTAQIPIAGPAADRTGRTGFSPNQTRLYGWMGAPTKWGPFRLFAQVNLMGDPVGIRFQVHRVWAHWAWLHIAYDYTQFLNLSTIPNTLDYEGPNAIPETRRGQAYLRIPLARLGQSTDWYVSIGAEQADIEATLPADVLTRDNVPSVIGRIIYAPSRADIQLAGMYRRMRFTGAGFDSKLNGWGISAQGSVHFLENDEFIFGALYGEGLGSYMQDTAGFGLDAAPDGTEIRTIPAFGGWLALTHYWLVSLSSTATFGYVFLDNDFDATPNPVGTYHDTYYVSVNLIWTPWHAIDTGLEYMFGRRTVTANTAALGETSNVDHRLQMSLLFRFEYSRKGVQKTMEPSKDRP